LNELPDLFFKRHLAEQAIHSGLEDWIGELSVGWMRGFPRIVRWSRFGGLCRCIRFASGHYQQDDCTEKKAAEAEIRRETRATRIHENATVAALRFHSWHKFSPDAQSDARKMILSPLTIEDGQMRTSNESCRSG
jgi:hypothetical protein